MSHDETRALIEVAMAGVKVVVCPVCRGLGKIPKALYVTCPHCGGCGETIEHTEQETAHG